MISTRVIKSRIMKWSWYVAHKGGGGGGGKYRAWVGKPKETNPLGGPRRRRKVKT